MPTFNQNGIGDDYLKSIGADAPYQPPEMGMLQRAGILVGEAPIRALNNLSASAANILQLPQDARGGFLSPEEAQLPDAQSTSAKIANVALGGFLPAAYEMGGIGKFLPSIAGESLTSQLANRAARNAIEFGTLGAQENSQTGLEQAGEGAILGGLAGLPLPARALGSVALGLGSKGYFDSQNSTPIGNAFGHDFTQGDISGIMQSAFGILGGQVKAPNIPTVSTSEFNGLMLPSEQIRSQIDPSVIPINPRPINLDPNSFGDNGIFYAGGPQPAPRPLGLPEPAIEGEFTKVYQGPPELNPIPDIASRAQPIQDFQQSQSQELLHSRVPQQARGPKFPFANQPEVVPLGGPIVPPELRVAPQTPQQEFISRLFHPDEANYLKQQLHVDVGQPQAQSAFMQLALALTTKEVRTNNRAKSIAFAKFFADLHNRADVSQIPADAFEQTIQQGTSPLHSMQSVMPEMHLPVDSAPPPFTSWDTPPPELPPSKSEVINPNQNSPLQGKPEDRLQLQLNDVRDKLRAAQDAQRIGAGDEDTQYEIESLKRVEAHLSTRLTEQGPGGNPVESAIQSEDQVNQSRSKGKIPDLPEYRRTEGGGINPDLLSALGFGSIRAAGGYALGYSVAANDPEQKYDPVETGALVAGLALASPYSRRLIDAVRHFSGKIDPTIPRFNEGMPPPKFRSTIKVGDYDPAMSYGNTVEQKDWQAGVESKQATADRLNADQTVKGKVADLPEYMRSEGGFILPELSAATGRGVLGGLVGGAIGAQTDDPNEHSGWLTGAMIGAGAGVFGPSIIRAATKALAEKKIEPIETNPNGRALKGGIGNFIKNFNSILEEHAGASLTGSQLMVDRFARFLDKGFGLTMPQELKQALMEAKGVGSWLLDQVDSSLLKIGLRFNPSEDVKALTNSFLDGTVPAADYLHQMQNHISNDPNMKAYANFAVTARSSITGLQKMVRDGISDPKLRSIITASLDKYVTRSYRIFNDPRWIPSEQNYAKLTKEIYDGKFFGEGQTYQSVNNALRQYVRELKATKGSYAPVNPEGVQISQQALRERKQLSGAWKEFLGEVRDPTERVYQTIFRLRPMAEAAKFFDNVSKLDVRGLPQVFASQADHEAFRLKLMDKLQADPENPDLKYQEAALKSFQSVEQQSQYGELGGKFVSRNVWDNLKTFDSTTEITHPVFRAMANANTAIKLGRTALNPISIFRNAITAPVFGMIGRMDYQDLPTAWKIASDANHPLRKEVLEMGIHNVDQVKTEFFKEFENITGSKYNFGQIDLSKLGMGNIDLDLAERVARRGSRSVLDFYRMPDNLTRIGTYLSAKRRISQELNLGLDDAVVKQKAAEFTNRYTMNYDAIVPAVKLLRNIPLANLFISYTAEMARIGKNLMEDVITGKGDGLTAHGRMYAGLPLLAIGLLPEMIQSSAENDLSPKDKADWLKAKALMPDYNRTRFQWNIKRDQKTGQFTYTDFTPYIPSDAFNQIGRAIAKGDWKALTEVNPVFGTQNSPLLNIVMSQITGKDLHTQKEFRDMSDRFASIAKEVVPPNTPGVGSEAIRYQQATIPNADGTLGITNKAGEKLTPADFWQVYYTGLKPGSVNLTVLQQRAESQAKQDVANEISYANQILTAKDVAPEVKQRELQKTKAALELIRNRYAAQLGVTQMPTSGASNAVASSNQ